MQKDRTEWIEIVNKNGIIWKENCPFCKPEEKDEKPVLYKTKYWEIRYNKYPYWWLKKHLLVFPIRHVEEKYKLLDEELLWLKEINIFIEKFYSWEAYFSFIRETFSWRSIKHIHYHYIPWDIYGEDLADFLNKKQHQNKWKI